MSKAIHPIMYVIAAIFFLSCFLYYIPWGGRQPGVFQPRANDTVVAKVNGEDVPRDLYERAVQFSIRVMEQRSGQANQKPGLREYHMARGQGYEAVVDDILRSQAATKEGIEIPNSEIRKTVNEQVKAELDRVGEGATAQEKRQYEQQIRSMADDQTIRRSMLSQRLSDKLREKFKPTEADLMASYNEVKTRHILIKATQATQAEALKKANEVLAKAKAGGDFAKLAKEYSQDTASKNNGGDVGWVTANSSFVPEFTEAARKMKKGEIVGPVATMFGYHIMKADDVRVNMPKDIKDAKKKQEYMDRFSDQTIQNKTQTFFASLRMQATIEPIDPWVAGYMRENESMSAQQAGDMADAQRLMAEAIKHYEEAATRNDLAAGPPLYAKLAELYNNTRQDDKALAMLAKVVDSNPSADQYIMQGDIYERRKDTANAVKALQGAMKLADSQPWLYLQLQQSFKRLKRPDLAKACYDRWTAFSKKPNMNGLTPGMMPNLGLPAHVGG
jgi:foldase protein PrsA